MASKARKAPYKFSRKRINMNTNIILSGVGGQGILSIAAVTIISGKAASIQDFQTASARNSTSTPKPATNAKSSSPK